MLLLRRIQKIFLICFILQKIGGLDTITHILNQLIF